jgi:hypothetical protein
VIRLREEFLDHPKFADLSPDAIVLWLGALGYCRLHQTDGWLPERVAIKLVRGTKKPALVLGELTVPPRSSPHLRPLLERCEAGYRMVGYLEHNESKEQMDELRRGKAEAGAAGGRRSGEVRAKQTASDDRSSRGRSDPIRTSPSHTDPVHADPDQEPEPREFRDPAGIAPPGEDPDAYPGAVEPLTLSPPPAKPKAKRPPKGPRPDIDPDTLNPDARAAYEAILAEPTFGPITDRPAEAARDFANLYPRLDLAQAIREIGVKVRASDRTYVNGARTLANWLPNSRCFRAAPPLHAPPPPSKPRPPPYNPNAKYMGGAFDHIQEARKAAEEAARKKAEEH